MFFPLHTYFLPTHRNGEVLVLEKLPNWELHQNEDILVIPSSFYYSSNIFVVISIFILGNTTYKSTIIEPINGCKFGGTTIHLSFSIGVLPPKKTLVVIF
jgi:hypothetical protein